MGGAVTVPVRRTTYQGIYDVGERRMAGATEKALALLADIESGVVDGTTTTTALLQKCIVLGGRAGSQRLRDWASKELNGYSGEPVPEYRKTAGVIQVDAVVGRTIITGQTIASFQLPKFARDAGVDEVISLNQGLGELEDLAVRDNGAIKFTIPGASTIAAELDRESGQPFQQTHSLYWSISRSAVRGVVERVRTALAEFVGELLDQIPADAKEVPTDVVERAVTLLVTGERASVNLSSAAGPGSSANVASSASGGVTMGDNFSDISDSTIINRSQVTNALNRLNDEGNNESAEALRQLTELVEQSGNGDAADVLDNFTEELNKSEPRKGILRASWEQIKVLVPVAGSSATIATGIANLLS